MVQQPVKNKTIVSSNSILEIANVVEKSTVCIKSKVKENNTDVNLEKVRSVITSNGIKVSKTSVNNKNGDVYVDLPNGEEREKLIPLLDDTVIEGNKVVKIGVKTPVITLRNVSDYTDKETFVNDVKLQNSKIKDKVENGAIFTVIFAKEYTNSDGISTHNVVVKVSPEIRDVLKIGGDRIYLGFSSYRVQDRFYVKKCSKCHRIGHYSSECSHSSCCGYCTSEGHTSDKCPLKENNDKENYKCINCAHSGKESIGHSALWPKCPVFLERQEQVKRQIPYFSSKNAK